MTESLPKNNKPIGAGAAAFARELIAGLDEYEALEITGKLVNGILPVEADSRTKQCVFCEHYYRDATRNNSSKTCSAECKISRDTARRKQKLNVAREDDPTLRPRITNKEQYYFDDYEYPFWIGHDNMDAHHHNYERPHEDVMKIAAASERNEIMGGRIGRRSHADRWKDYYDGDWSDF